MYGNFDVAGIMVTPDLYLPSVLGGILDESGQHIHRGILPAAPTSVEDDEDFNLNYLRSLDSAASRTVQDLLPADERFVSIVKLKINPAVTWTTRSQKREAREGGAFEHRVRAAYEQAWHTTQKWIKECDGCVQAALTYGLGWNEFLVVAHAGSLAPLLDLTYRYRHLFAKVPTDRGKNAHLFTATITRLGHDWLLSKRAEDAIRAEDNAHRATGPRTMTGEEQVASGHRCGIPAQRILACAEEVVAGLVEKGVGANLKVGAPIYLRPTLSVYPGHEGAIKSRLREFRAVMVDAGFGNVIRGEARWEVGTKDVTAPRICTSDSFPDVKAVVLLDLLHRWLIRDGVYVERNGHPTSYVSAHTVVGFELSGSVEEPARLENHTLKLPWHLFGTLGDPLRASIAPTADDLRRLQVSRARTEEVITTLRTCLWGLTRLVMWEEMIALSPALLCLVERVAATRADVDCLQEKIIGYTRDSPTFEPRPTGALPERAEDAVSNNVATAADYEGAFAERVGSVEDWEGSEEGEAAIEVSRRAKERLIEFDDELTELITAIRTNLHARHLTGYLADEMVDVNVIYRGSVHQLLAVTNMLLDTIASVLIGPRATLATVGQTASPEVSAPCGVILAQLDADTLTSPILLDSIAHEVGHEFAHGLILSSEDGGTCRNRDRNGWASARGGGPILERLTDAVDEFWTNYVPYDQDAEDQFQEVVADFVERRLLEEPGTDGFSRWLRSLLLRAVMVAPSQHVPDWMARSDVPQLDIEILSSVILRACHVRVWELLAERERATPTAPDDLEANEAAADSSFREFWETAVVEALEHVGLTLRTSCVVGPSHDLNRDIADPERWARWLQAGLHEHDWYHTHWAGSSIARLASALSQYLDDRSETAIQDESSVWSEIRTEMTRLRAVVTDAATPSLYVRSWRPSDASGEIPERTDGVDPEWFAVAQPPEVCVELEPVGSDRSGFTPKTVIIQRGRVSACSEDVAKSIHGAESEFLISLFELLPRWRTGLCEKIESIESRAN